MTAPLYRRISTALRQRIASGEYAPGERVPSEEELCEEFQVSRSTMRKALDELVSVGLIVRHRGRGTYVSTGVTPAILESIVSPTFASVMTAHQHRLLNAQLIRADESGMDLPGIEADTTMLRVLREKTDARGQVLLRESNVLPTQLAPRLDLGRRHHDWTVLELLLNVGLPVSLMNVTVEPTVLRAENAAVFAAPVGQPTFRYVSRFWSPMGRIVAATEIIYRPGYYQLTVDLSLSDEMVQSGDPSCQSTPLAREAIRTRAMAHGIRSGNEEGPR